jgi:hypothetical protein
MITSFLPVLPIGQHLHLAESERAADPCEAVSFFFELCDALFVGGIIDRNIAGTDLILKI